MEQKTKRRTSSESVCEAEPQAKKRSEETQELLDNTDAILDEIDKAVAENEKPEVQPFTLADVMRKGASMSPQTTGAYARVDGSTCALGAAALGAKELGLF